MLTAGQAMDRSVPPTHYERERLPNLAWLDKTRWNEPSTVVCRLVVAVLASIICFADTSHANSITSQTFSAASLTVDTTGASDWGRAGSSLFGDNPSGTLYSNMTDCVASGSSSIGMVTVSELSAVDPKSTTAVAYSFDGTTAYGAYGSLAAAEDNAWSVTFSDLGVGTHTLTLYLGHSDVNRVFQMDASLDGGAYESITSSTIGSYGGDAGGRAFKYVIVVESTASTTDLTLRFGSKSGGSGEAYWAGYAVVSIPPSPGPAESGSFLYTK